METREAISYTLLLTCAPRIWFMRFPSFPPGRIEATLILLWGPLCPQRMLFPSTSHSGPGSCSYVWHATFATENRNTLGTRHIAMDLGNSLFCFVCLRERLTDCQASQLALNLLKITLNSWSSHFYLLSADIIDTCVTTPSSCCAEDQGLHA